MYELLDNINSPRDVKVLSIDQLPQLAEEIRTFLIANVTETGGHLASNLGVVELTIAMIYVYDYPQDKIIWDVGHQSYVYKILTGRKDRMDTLRQYGGISGFPDRAESRYDCFNTGHASTSISAALGMARANEIEHVSINRHITAVIGDGSLTGGLAWEGLNDLGESELPVTIVLNDNNMSIDRNVGGLSHRMNVMRLSKGYAKLKLRVAHATGRIPPLYRYLKRCRDYWKRRLLHNEVFEQFGVSYFGPVDGHDLRSLIEYFNLLKNYNDPALLHVVTKKGKGYESAENNPTHYHGINPKGVTSKPSFSDEAGHVMCKLARRYSSIAVVTAAMTHGTGFDCFGQEFPERTFDVGIAEEHAVTMAAGLAVGGIKPYVAIYSTFLQRAFDQLLHDVCLMDLPVTLCIDRAGISNGDGPTHHGIYDIGYLTAVPNMTVFAPKNFDDLQKILTFSVAYDHPLAIRYPKECVYNKQNTTYEIEIGKWEVLLPLSNANVITYGDRMLDLAYEVCEQCRAGLINAAFLKPIDGEILTTLADSEKIVVLEDAVSDTGLFSAVSKFYAKTERRSPHIVPIGLPEKVIMFGENEEIFNACGISRERLTKALKS